MDRRRAPALAWNTTPLLVDTLTNGVSTDASERNVSVAYDVSTKEIGIAYNVTSVGNGPGDGNPYVVLASRKVGAATFTTQTVSAGLSSVVGTAQPVIAMAAGQLYIAYWPFPTTVIRRRYARTRSVSRLTRVATLVWRSFKCPTTTIRPSCFGAQARAAPSRLPTRTASRTTTSSFRWCSKERNRASRRR